MDVDILASKDAQVTFPAAPTKKGKDIMPPSQPSTNAEFPVPCKRFLATLENTADHIWVHWLDRMHGRENHKMSDWTRILTSHKDGTYRNRR